MTTTNGWDAVCALELSEVNDLLLQEHLHNAAPGSPGLPLAFGTMSGSNNWLATVVFSPPELSFDVSDPQQATLSVTMQSASMVGTGGTLAVWLPVGKSPLLRTVQVESVAGGIDALGQVVATFAGTNVAPYGVSLMDAVSNGVLSAPMSYVLGTILNANSGPGLQPSSFDFALQNSSDGTRSALVLLIATSSAPGTAGPLPQFPLPAGSTAGLTIAMETMFTSILPAALESTFNDSEVAGEFPVEPLQLSVQQNADGSWQMTATAGIASFASLVAIVPSVTTPPISPRPGDPYAQTVLTPPATGPACQVPFTGEGTSFTVAFAQGTLSIAWTAAWWQLWTVGALFEGNKPTTTPVGNMLFTYTCVSTAAIDPTTEIVTLVGTETSSLSLGPMRWPPAQLAPFFAPPALLYLYPSYAEIFTASLFPTVPVASINTFVLDNLLFPEESNLSLTGMTFPGDIVLTGSLTKMITVTPATATIPGGTTLQFSTVGGQYWRCSGGGEIGITTGLYRAPAVQAAIVVSVESFDAKGATTYAQVTVVPSQQQSAIVVTPAYALLSPSSGVEITITDANGTPVGATCTLRDGDPGALTPLDANAYTWLYTAPGSSGAQITVIATSNADPAQFGTTAIVVTQPDAVTVTWADGTSGSVPRAVSPGQTIELSASAASGYDNLSWAIFPQAGGGSIVPVDGDPTRAVLTVPPLPRVRPRLPYSVCAYYADQSVPAFGTGGAFFDVDPEA